MRGYRFYLEYQNNADKRRGTVKSPGTHCGTVVAVSTDRSRGYISGGHYVMEGVSSVFQVPDSSVTTTAISPEYLRQDCRRIPEVMAREIHPTLFRYLEEPE